MAARHIGSVVLVASLVLAGCGDGGSGSDDATGPGEPVDVGLVDGYEADVLVDGLDGPTQVSAGPDGALLVAQLAGEENAGTGQILSIAADGQGEPQVLFDGLTKPTGVVMVDDEIWVMEERTLLRGPAAGGELTAVLTDLPFNGRSEGTLNRTPDGEVLYNTSGTIDGDDAQDGSATLFALDPASDPPEPEALATGFKHAYATTYDADGTLWSTEMSDGLYGGEPASDELVRVDAGDDFGWPLCVGDQTPVELYGATEASCARTPRPHALFEPGASPTGVAIAPWDPDLLVVALWVEGRVVTVPRAGGPRSDEGGEPLEVATLLDGVERPQHLLTDGDRLLVTDYATGRIVAITET